MAIDGGHIVDNLNGKLTLCGLRYDEVGYTWAPFVGSHIDGHNPDWCYDCFDTWKDSTYGQTWLAQGR